MLSLNRLKNCALKTARSIQNDRNDHRCERLVVVSIILLVLLGLGILALHRILPVKADEFRYLYMARNLANFGSIELSSELLLPRLPPRYPPAYSILLAPSQFMQLPPTLAYRLALFLNIIMICSAVLFWTSIARRILVSVTARMLFLVLIATCSDMCYWAQMAMSENLFVLVLALLAYFWLLFGNRPSFQNGLGLALCLLLAVATRQAGLVLIPALTVLVTISIIRETGFSLLLLRKMLLHGLILVPVVAYFILWKRFRPASYIRTSDFGFFFSRLTDDALNSGHSFFTTLKLVVSLFTESMVAQASFLCLSVSFVIIPAFIVTMCSQVSTEKPLSHCANRSKKQNRNRYLGCSYLIIGLVLIIPGAVLMTSARLSHDGFSSAYARFWMYGRYAFPSVPFFLLPSFMIFEKQARSKSPKLKLRYIFSIVIITLFITILTSLYCINRNPDLYAARFSVGLLWLVFLNSHLGKSVAVLCAVLLGSLAVLCFVVRGKRRQRVITTSFVVAVILSQISSLYLGYVDLPRSDMRWTRVDRLWQTIRSTQSGAFTSAYIDIDKSAVITRYRILYCYYGNVLDGPPPSTVVEAKEDFYYIFYDLENAIQIEVDHERLKLNGHIIH